ncbi:hypothetical protein EZV62_026715 [Acer yangbiense]|uniref:ADP,ATP carrier protein n=1 Tax=Acer yangbiense TaxID=1000413 RepID=A0A5C7GRN6_9ROSI|nr:hypothetical protein EZV62_026715 [Acer yangbiense]
MWATNMMATAPVNRVMVLMRCQNEMIKSGRLSHPYKGIGDCFARTVRNEGILSLWKGNTAQMMGSITAKYTMPTAIIVATGTPLLLDLITYPMHTVVHRMMMRSGEAVKVIVLLQILNCKMADGSLHPSIYMKIHGKPCLFIRNFHKTTQDSNSIPATLAFFNGVLHSHLGSPQQGSGDSPTVTPMPSSSVGIPSKKGNVPGPVFRSLLWATSMIETAPVNRVMVLMRCQNEMIKSCRLSHPYKGIGDCFARTVRNEGILSLWKGNTAHMMAFIPAKVLTSGHIGNSFLSLFNYKKDKDKPVKTLVGLLAADGLSRAVNLFFIHPLEYAKTRMATDIKPKSIFEKRQFNGIIDVFRKTLKTDGIAGLYRGYKTAYVLYYVRDVLFFVAQPKLLLQMLGLQDTITSAIILGAGPPLLVDLIIYPIHTVVHRMMMRSGEAVKLNCKMEDGSLYPSIYEKILWQPCLFIRNFHKTQASNSIPATLAFFNGVLHSYLGPPHQGSASPTVTPVPSKSVGVPSKKGNDIGPVFRSLLWVTAMMTTAPANRVMILTRCQKEIIKSGRLSHPYKGIGDCFARTVRNEGIISLWKGNTAHMMGLITKKVLFTKVDVLKFISHH